MENKDLILTFLNSITEDSYHDAKRKYGSNVYFFKYLGYITAKKQNQSLDLELSDYLTANVFFESKDSSSRPIARGSVKGNQISRPINHVGDFIEFLEAFPLSKEYSKIFNRDDDPGRTYNKIIIARAILRELDMCDRINVSYESNGISFTLKDYVHYDASIEPINRRKFVVRKFFMDRKLEIFNTNPPEGKSLSPEEKVQRINGSYSRGIKTMYSDKVYVTSHQEVIEEINTFFEERYELLEMIRREAGYI